MGSRGVLWAVCINPLHICFRCVTFVLPVVLLIFGGLYLKLINSPLSVPFLVEPITRALNAELSGMNVGVEDAVLHLSPRGGLEFRLKTVRVKDQHAAPIAMAAFAGIELSWRALLMGRIAPARIDLIEPQLLLSRNDQGQISVSVTERQATKGEETNIPERSRQSGASSEPGPVGPSVAGQSPSGTVHFDLARAVAHLVSQARQGGEVASHLEAVGFRDASVVFDDRGQKLIWKVPELRLGLAHKQKRSQVTLDARILSGASPWTFSMRAEQAEKSKTIPLKIKFDKLDPRDVARAMPGFAAFEALNVLLSGAALIELTPDGDVLQAGIDIAVGSGSIEWVQAVDGPGTDQGTGNGTGNGTVKGAGQGEGQSFPVDKGSIALSFEGQTRQVRLTSASLVSGASTLNLEGRMSPPPAGATSSVWAFDLRSLPGTQFAPVSQSSPVSIEQLELRGSVAPASAEIELNEFMFKAGGIDVAATGKFGPEIGVEGKVGPASVAKFLALWPTSVAPGARALVLERMTKGEIQTGSFKALRSADGGERRFSLSLEAADLEVKTRPGLPPLEAARALIRLEGGSLEITVPEASIAPSANRKLLLKATRITMIGLDQARPVAEIATRVQGPLPAVLELVANSQIPALRDVKLPSTGVDGKTDAQFKITVPVDGAATMADARIEGKVRITDGRVKDIIGTHDISGATVTIEAGEKGFDLKGEMLFAGVLAKVNGQWFTNPPDGRQPPLRITARLDNADRTQLGLDLDELVQGEVPFEVTVHRGAADDVRIHVTGDLTSAELMLDEVQWSKPVGRPARLDFDVGKGRNGKGIELQNFKVSGENIAIDGWVAMGPDNKVREYYFPDFSLNVVTNLDVKGTLRPDRVWVVVAKGKTFNGADLFRALFTFNSARPKPVRKNKPGIDISAEIDTVLGPDDTVLRQIKLHATKRAGQFDSLDLSGILEGGAELRATLRVQPGQPRILVANTRDTGAALKLIGFYPNMIGGKGELRVNVDGGGAVDKNGTLQVNRFKVLGDPVIAEVLQTGETGENGRPRPGAKQRIVREQFDFDEFEGVFAVGNGQLAIEKALVKGPLIGASLKGKIDFKTKRMQLGGTYVPLSGLNRILSKIPIIAPIFTGPQGEGVFGITFLIEGSTADPQVSVNPLSLVAPGITREIFQMAPDNPHVTPRADPPGPEAVSPQLRASPPTEKRAAPAVPADATVGDSWSQKSVTKDTNGKRK